MVRQEVLGDGNCLIHTMLRCSDYDPNDDESAYTAKVKKLRADIVTFMVDHADNEEWKAYYRTEGFTYRRGKKTRLAANYDDYCNEMGKDGTYMGDLETQAFCNMRHASFQVATDAIVSRDNPQPPVLVEFTPQHMLNEAPWIVRNNESLATYHLVYRGVGHYEPCLHYECLFEKISPVEPGSQSPETNKRNDDPEVDQHTDGSDAARCLQSCVRMQVARRTCAAIRLQNCVREWLASKRRAAIRSQRTGDDIEQFQLDQAIALSSKKASLGCEATTRRVRQVKTNVAQHFKGGDLNAGFCEDERQPFDLDCYYWLILGVRGSIAMKTKQYHLYGEKRTSSGSQPNSQWYMWVRPMDMAS